MTLRDWLLEQDEDDFGILLAAYKLHLLATAEAELRKAIEELRAEGGQVVKQGELF